MSATRVARLEILRLASKLAAIGMIAGTLLASTGSRCAGAATMPNGPGMSMNGPGMGMNGPELGQSYATFQGKQNDIGLAYVTFTGARTTSKVQLSSVSLIKGELRGTLPHGVRLTGTGFSEVILQARGLKDGQEAGDRTVLITRAEAAAPGKPLEDPDFFHYFIRVTGPLGVPTDPCDGGYAIAVPGSFDYRSGVKLLGGSYTQNDRVFTFACQHTAIQKCAEGLHYKPWRTFQGPRQSAPASSVDCANNPSACLPSWPYPGKAALQACTRMIRSDFCGDGTPLTVDGTLIDIDDNFSDDGAAPTATAHAPQEGWSTEARWGESGASCAEQTRQNSKKLAAYIRDNPENCKALRETECSKGKSLTELFNDRSEPVLLNRSQKKLVVYLPAAAATGTTYGRAIATYVDKERKQILIAVGAPGVIKGSEKTATERAAVHIFRLYASDSEKHELGERRYVTTLFDPDGPNTGSQFGWAVAFRKGDRGPDLLVGAPEHADRTGIVYAFPSAGWPTDLSSVAADEGPSWGTPTAIPSPIQVNDVTAHSKTPWSRSKSGFGQMLASAPDGRVFVGAPDAECGHNVSGGVFVIEPGSLALSPLLNECPPPSFGSMIYPINNTTLLIGSPNDGGLRINKDCRPGEGNRRDGVVRLYTRQRDGSYTRTWELADPSCYDENKEKTRYFGWTAALEGSKLFVSAANATVDNQPLAGKVYIYDYSATATPSLSKIQKELVNPTPAHNDIFGSTLAPFTTSTGKYLAVGVPVRNTLQSEVLFYKEERGTYKLQRTLTDPFSLSSETTGFGIVLQVQPPFLFIGAPAASDGKLPRAGYIFHHYYTDNAALPPVSQQPRVNGAPRTPGSQ